MATLPADLLTPAPRRVRPSLSVVAGDGVAAPAVRYGEGQGVRWPLVGAIAAGHVLVAALLLMSGVVHLARHEKPIVAALIPDMAKPQEQPAPPVELQDVPVSVAVPEVLVETPHPQPSPIAVTTQPTPPAAPVAAAVPVAQPGPPVAAPVTPPDFEADQLGNPGPRYPVMSRRNHEQGTATLKVLVSSEGAAQTLSVARSSGFTRLDDAALDTVRKWKFLPARQAGRAVAAWVLVPVTFALG